MDLRDRLVIRYKLADQIADPSAGTATFGQHLEQFSKLEPFLKNLQGPIDQLKELRARDPNAIPRGDAKPLFDQLTSNDPLYMAAQVATMRSFYTWFNGAWQLALSILQQFNLPAPTRRKIEQMAKFWASKRNPKPKRNNATSLEDRYNFVFSVYFDQLKILREQHAALLEALAKGAPMSEGDGKIKAGPFTLVNTGGFSEAVMNEVSNTVQKAASLMTAHGLGKVCYGDVLVSKKVGRSTVLAFYLQDSDELFVRAGLRINVDSVRTVIHELGHRLHRKFLSGKDRQIDQLYIRYNTRKEVGLDGPEPPAIGTVVKYKGKDIVVTRIDYAKRTVWLGEPGGNPNRFSVPIKDYASVFSEEPAGSEASPKGFVTPYAGKNAAENFAEMISFYCLDKLSPEQVKDLEAIL